MDFESPDVEKDFPGLYASESGRKSNESDLSEGAEHDKPSKKELLIGRRKDKKEKKDRGYAALAGESSSDEDTETKSPSKSKKTKSFKFPSKSKEKREKSREKEKCSDDVAKLKDQAEKEKKKEKEKREKEKEKKDKEKKDKHREKEKEDKAKFKLDSKEKFKDKEKEKTKEKEKEKEKTKEKEKSKEKEKDKVKDKDKDKKDKKLKDKVQTTVTSGIPFEEIFTLGVALPIFGVSLQASIERSRCHDDTRLPLVIRDSIDYLQAYGLRCPQIYRAEADRVKLSQLRKLYEDRGATFPYHWDVPVACAILKMFISELPESILTQEYGYQLEQTTAMSEAQRDSTLVTLIAKLPEENRTLLGWLIVHFKHVVDLEAVNECSLAVLSGCVCVSLGVSNSLLSALITKADLFFPEVKLTKYIPPLQKIPSELTLENPELISQELRAQESLLNQLHAEMHAGFVTPAREEQLWEGQRIVTQLKRMLRSAQKTLEPSLSTQQPSIDDKQEDEPVYSQSGIETITSRSQSNPPSSDDGKTSSSVTLTSNDAFQPEHKNKESPTDKKEAFEDDFDLDSKEVAGSETTDDVAVRVPFKENQKEKPTLSEKEMKLLRLQLENAEYLQLKSLLQAKINSEQFEIVKLRSHMAIKSKLETNQNKEKDNCEQVQDDAEIKQKLVKENATLEQKRLNLINQIFQERVACIQLKIELAMNEIL